VFRTAELTLCADGRRPGKGYASTFTKSSLILYTSFRVPRPQPASFAGVSASRVVSRQSPVPDC